MTSVYTLALAALLTSAVFLPVSAEQTVPAASSPQAAVAFDAARVMAEAQAHLDVARKNRDVIKVNSINDKIIRLRGMNNLLLSIGDTDPNAVTQRLMAQSKMIQLLDEIRNAVGEELAYVGNANVTPEVGPPTEEELTFEVPDAFEDTLENSTELSGNQI